MMMNLFNVIQLATAAYASAMIWIITGALMLLTVEFILKVFSLLMSKIKHMGE